MPGPQFFSTCATITVALYIALAVQLRLVQPRPAERATSAGDRFAAGFVFATLLLGVVGVAADIGALGSRPNNLERVTGAIGAMVTLALFFAVTTDALVFRLFGPLARTRVHRVIFLVTGLAAFAAGVTMIALKR